MNPVTSISLGRIAIGTALLVKPDLAGKAFGVASEPQVQYVSRLFASREVALGAVTLLSRGRVRAGLTVAGIGVDAADAATGYLGAKQGQVATRSGMTMAAVGAAAVLAGAMGLLPKRSKKRAKKSIS